MGRGGGAGREITSFLISSLKSLPKTWLILLREKKEDGSGVLVGLNVGGSALSLEEMCGGFGFPQE